MLSDRIRLSDALEHFCDRQIWREYLAFFPDKRGALEALQPVARWALEQIARELSGDFAKRFELGNQLIAELKRALGAGTLAIEGFHQQTSKLVSLPAELCADLLLNFANGTASLGENRYCTVKVYRVEVAPGRDMVEVCEQWMRERRAAWRGEKDEKRDSLLPAARQQFGSEITDRDFSAAYTRVYHRRRGKPPSTHHR